MCLLGNALLMISAGQNVWAVKWLGEWSARFKRSRYAALVCH